MNSVSVPILFFISVYVLACSAKISLGEFSALSVLSNDCIVVLICCCPISSADSIKIFSAGLRAVLAIVLNKPEFDGSRLRFVEDKSDTADELKSPDLLALSIA